MHNPTLLDLFCGGGGASVGYSLSGYTVVGVDLHPQPHYPFTYHQADALTVLQDRKYLSSFDVIHASPPCQHYSDLAHRNANANAHPDLIGTVRSALQGIPDKTYVIENVEGAPLHSPLMLCGTMFPALRVIRHRLFESNVNVPLQAPPHGTHPLVFTHDKRKRHYLQGSPWTGYVQVTGGGNAPLSAKRDAMGIWWRMTSREVNEAIPPAYTEHIGRQLQERI